MSENNCERRKTLLNCLHGGELLPLVQSQFCQDAAAATVHLGRMNRLFCLILKFILPAAQPLHNLNFGPDLMTAQVCA
jgi:hypothetical protein